MTKSCLHCGADVPPAKPRGQPRKFCSDKCAVDHWRAEHKVVAAYVAQACEVCGKETGAAKRTGKAKRFCSKVCSHAAWIKTHPERRVEHVRAYDNSEHGRATHRAWREANAEPLKEYRAAQYAANPEYFLEKAASFAAENPEKVREYKNTYANTERGKQKAHEGVWRRIARKRASPGSFTKSEFMAMCRNVGWRCLACLKQFAVLEADHVVPLAGGGHNSIDNIQPLCRTCNAGKGASYRDYRPEFLCQPVDLMENAA